MAEALDGRNTKSPFLWKSVRTHCVVERLTLIKAAHEEDAGDRVHDAPARVDRQQCSGWKTVTVVQAESLHGGTGTRIRKRKWTQSYREGMKDKSNRFRVNQKSLSMIMKSGVWVAKKHV